MTNVSKTTLVLASFLAFAGCNNGSDDGTASRDGDSTAGSEDGASSRSAQRHVDLTPAGGGRGQCEMATVYFAYDSANLDDSSRRSVDTAVQCFRSRGAPARLHLTGATDPRGTEEYNIALGERRADSVRRYLVALGVQGERIAISSLGEEAAEGVDEHGWARDRNVTAIAEN